MTGKIIQFPIVRIIIVALFIVPYLLIHNNFIADFVASASGAKHFVLEIADVVVSLLVILLLYRFYTRYIEKRDAVEVSGSRSVSEIGWGVLISLGLVGFMVLLMTILGYYRIERVNSPEILISSLFFFGMGAFIQEMAFCVVLFRLIEELLGSWYAFIVVSVIFGIAHLGNPEAGVWSTTALILGEVMLIAAFVYTRRLWFVWGIHLGWNYFQDGVFGMPNSGVTEFDSWIQPVVNGPAWVTGGNFGIETSYIAVFLSLIVGLLILKRALKRKQIVSPVWRRK